MSNMPNNPNWKAEKSEERKEVFRMLDISTKEILESPMRFKNYLKLQGQFDRYSVTNVLLINKQKPAATKLKDFDGWAKEDRHIIKGMHAIKILQPEKYTMQDGREGTSYQVKKIFDVSQVTGVEKSAFPTGRDRMVTTLVRALPYQVKEVESLDFDNNGAYYQEDEQCLYVVSGARNNQYFLQFLTMEIGYAEIKNQFIHMDDPMANFMAKCVACEVCGRYGQNVDPFEFDDIPDDWKKLEPKDLRKRLNDVREASNRIIARTNEILYHRSKERDQVR
ncbi:MAG: hypothetical protein J5589_09730 [Firmicutes bacterium]|nr:hypothetical protein [Bacillota bacterium]